MKDAIREYQRGMAFVLAAICTFAWSAGAAPAAGGSVEKILFSSDRDGDYEIYMMDTDGSNQVPLTTHPGPDSQPSWSPSLE